MKLRDLGVAVSAHKQVLLRTQTHNSSYIILCVLRLLVYKTIHKVHNNCHTHIISVRSSCKLINLTIVNYPRQAIRVHKVRPSTGLYYMTYWLHRTSRPSSNSTDKSKNCYLEYFYLLHKEKKNNTTKSSNCAYC